MSDNFVLWDTEDQRGLRNKKIPWTFLRPCMDAIRMNKYRDDITYTTKIINPAIFYADDGKIKSFRELIINRVELFTMPTVASDKFADLAQYERLPQLEDAWNLSLLE